MRKTFVHFTWFTVAPVIMQVILAAPFESDTYAHLRERNEKRIKEITQYIAAEAKKQQDAWVLAKRAQDQAAATQNNPNGGMGPGMGPGGMPAAPAPAADNTPPVPDKFEISEELIQAAVTKKFGGNLMDAAGPFPKVDIRDKIELTEAAGKLPEIKKNFQDAFEMTYAVQPMTKTEAAATQERLQAAAPAEAKQLELQILNKEGEWVAWTPRAAEARLPEWRVAIRLEPVTPQAIQKVEELLAEIEYPLYRENDLVEISFSPTERVARRTYKGGFKRIGRFKVVIGKDILGLNDIPEKLRARFDDDLNRRARLQVMDRRPVFTRISLACQDFIDAKVKEMLTRQFEQNLGRGWVYIDGGWKTPADMVHDVLVYRRQHDAATREMYKKQMQHRQQEEQMQQEQGGAGGYRR